MKKRNIGQEILDSIREIKTGKGKRTTIKPKAAKPQVVKQVLKPMN